MNEAKGSKESRAMQIITLALNPAIDRTMYVAKAKIGVLNRATAPTVTAVGGKGINNSFVFKKLGIDSLCLGFWSGDNGRLVQKSLTNAGVEFNRDFTECETRMNIKIISESDEPTEFNESGGPILPMERELMLGRIQECLQDGAEYFFMGGSVPIGIEKSFYRDILDLGSEIGDTKFIVDCDCDALKLCMSGENKPYMIKPNKFELEQFCGERFDLDNSFESELERIKDTITKIYDETGVIVLCTLGEHGGLYCGDEGVYYIPAPKVKLRGFTGAGDTFLTAFCAVHFGLFELPDISAPNAEGALKFAVAASAAKVTKPGTEFAEISEINSMMQIM